MHCTLELNHVHERLLSDQQTICFSFSIHSTSNRVAQLSPITSSVVFQYNTLFETTQPQRHIDNSDNAKSREIATPPFIYSTAREGQLDRR